MTPLSVLRYVILSLLFASLFACSSQPTVIKQGIIDNNLLLEDQQWALWRQTERLDEMTNTLELHSKVLNEISGLMEELKKQPEEVPVKTVAKSAVTPVQLPKKEKAIHMMKSPGEVSKTIIGRNEWVWIDLVGQTLKSRIDTGALSSALHATKVQPFERNGDKWIRFSLSEEANAPSFEAPLLRYVRIRQASAEKLDRRPVVKLKIRMGEIVEETTFSLNDRDNMNYPVLLGRDFLRDIAVVDVSKKFTQEQYKPVKPDPKNTK